MEFNVPFQHKYGYIRDERKRDLSLQDGDIQFLVRDDTETKTFLQFHKTEMRPRRLIFATSSRPCKAETGTFFDTFNLQHCAKTVNGDVQIKTIYVKLMNQ